MNKEDKNAISSLITMLVMFLCAYSFFKHEELVYSIMLIASSIYLLIFFYANWWWKNG